MRRTSRDFEIIRQLLRNRDLESWVQGIRECLQHPSCPLNLSNGRWYVKDRKALWQTLGSRVFDDHLDALKRCAVSVLLERDPQFELRPDDRYAAAIHGKVNKYSLELRKGLAETLALLGTQPAALRNCSHHKPETIVVLAIREIFEDADWVLWASLDMLLPTLAEASPDEFLSAVEYAFRQTPCPFDELFAQETAGFTGRNYMTGLLWALEALAWDEEFLVRACVLLGELAERDPGGNWGNRPANSLTTILLPWLPQTIAPVEKRRVALHTLQVQGPAVAWRLLLSLLPGKTRSSFTTHTPSWRTTIPDDWKKGVSRKEYWVQISLCANSIVQMAKNDFDKLEDLIHQLDSLPKPAFDQVLEHLSSDSVSNRPENERFALWNNLSTFARKHRRFSDAEWALSPENVSRIESVAAKLAPQNPLGLHRMLFTRYGSDLYEETGNIEEQERKLDERRQQAVEDILSYGGLDAILQFVTQVESPRDVGHSLGIVAKTGIDDRIFPSLLDTNDQKLAEFAQAYIWSRQYRDGWEWVDGLDRSNWSASITGNLLSCLPFADEAWKRVTDWLGVDEREYWNNARLTPNISDCDLSFAIDKLIEHRRPRVSLKCIAMMLHRDQLVDHDLIVRALITAVSSTEPFDSMATYEVHQIIKALQDDPETNPEVLFTVEWAYLPLLGRGWRTVPKTLDSRLSTDPAFFCEVIRILDRSKKTNGPNQESSERDNAIASNAWTLLHDWRTPPGTRNDGTFSPCQFNKWLSHVKESSDESGHIDAALLHIGQVLIHCPPDPQGLWIHHSVAATLNDKSADRLRGGFSNGIVNSRGVRFIDPSGQPERELAQQYRKKAEEVENAGYQRFAAELRRLALGFDREAEEIIVRERMESNGP